VTRRAIVFLRDLRQYEGEVWVADGLVHFYGERRVLTDGQVTHRPAGERTWPRCRIREIRWEPPVLGLAA
jgi:hypothetical protein